MLAVDAIKRAGSTDKAKVRDALETAFALEDQKEGMAAFAENASRLQEPLKEPAMYETLELERVGKIATIWMNRPASSTPSTSS